MRRASRFCAGEAASPGFVRGGAPTSGPQIVEIELVRYELRRAHGAAR